MDERYEDGPPLTEPEPSPELLFDLRHLTDMRGSSQAGRSITRHAFDGVAAGAEPIQAWIGGPYQTLAAMIR